ncbi:Planctomycete cytochrome C [Prosthecobacter debontii]|uniref:Planctomycete cytochrome C n=1 Tax=Prosthecobacter debontii TaxID=48467 RepID=A0A1T4YCS5_9BACT|nr:PSD1 and planctomycete cytochrome C domain-containing protein [Prosthecobacter debontii]SKA99510.1 Planctomycete cytochrome C [Prosthecobacter debontii]
MRLPLLALVSLAGSAFAAVDYSQEIKPLLQVHCVKCHGATTQKAKLRLDTAAAAMQGGGRGAAIQPGQAEASLLLQVVQGTHAEVPQMPYKRGPLDSAQVTLIQRWIAEGAHAPADEQPSDDRHWAYIAPERPTMPTVKSGATHPIDRFIEDRLQREGLALSSPAAPETQLRRLFLDLTGLPPTVEDVQAFSQGAKTETSYQATVDKLLDSPHYGERWGRWWLDQARYADSNGYSIDAPRSIWPYRDWVVQTLNADMPFDQFSIEQLAGDLLPKPTQSQLIATGFHRNTQINQEGGIDKEQFRIESIFDRVATTGTVWLGLTIGCAQCHDHKFDAISHEEYYQFYAFLNNQDEPTLSVPDPNLDKAALDTEQKALQNKITAYLKAHEADAIAWEKELSAEAKAQLPKDRRAALKKPREQRSATQQRLLYASGPGAADQTFRSYNERYMEITALLTKGVTTMVMKELPEPRKTTLYIKGDFTRPGAEMNPAVPAVLHDLDLKPTSAQPNRLDLARWLVRRDNPLTARVIVNRVWQQYFGRGLVETENDFGTMGSLPSHPELLDWLAVELMEHGWSLKYLHHLIVTSRTYRQNSSFTAQSAGATIDPNNLLLWRQNRLRLDAEIVRDVCLTASGLLNAKLGGAPVYPPIPDGVLSLGQVKRTWPLSKGADRYRRGLYTFVFRATPPPGLSVFDAPDGFSTCTRRLRSNTPLQALTLLNDQAFVEFAQALEKIVQRDGFDVAFQRCTARQPTNEEKAVLARLKPDELARVLLNLDETITRE